MTTKEIHMLIKRWQAPILPTREQIFSYYELEGLEPLMEEYNPDDKIGEHRHPFSEVRTVLQGELLLNVAGNQFLLRPGDRLEIPANTKHWHQTQGRTSCICICAQRVF